MYIVSGEVYAKLYKIKYTKQIQNHKTVMIKCLPAPGGPVGLIG